MGLNLKNGCFRDGERVLNRTDAATNKYFGGQPLCSDSNGVRLAKAADRAIFSGLAAVSSYEDLKNGNVTIISGDGLVQVTNGSASQDTTDPVGNIVEGAPYDTTVSFVQGNGVYISATGFLTNTGAAGTAIGTVVKTQDANSGSFDFYLFPTVTA